MCLEKRMEPYHHSMYPLLFVVAALFAALTYCIKRSKLITTMFWLQKDEERISETQYFILSDQRRIAFAVYGASNASLTVLYFHGTPSSHHEAFLLSEAGRRYGIRIISPSRPGSGGSDFRPDASLLDYPDDILALVDHLRIPRFGIIAVSGGAPYAFACWKRISRSRLTGLGIIAGIYPVATLGTDGMKLPSRLMLRIATWFPWIVAWLIDKQLGAVARDKDEKKMEALLVADMRQDSSVGQNEKVAWEAARPEIRRAIVTSVREGVKYGGKGIAWEMRLLGSRWGFDLDEIQPNRKGELVMWHGDADANVPLVMVERAAARLGKHAELRIIEGQGHGTLTLHKADEVMSTMKANSWRC
ncbi:Putative hydrolase YcgS [Madurella fahalii]|uniref:Hydrolase YcgS n=1 Tax=Madurella fahalii TaxID=1157608 RepID=A0ABQ0GGX9_9PEZI